MLFNFIINFESDIFALADAHFLHFEVSSHFEITVRRLMEDGFLIF